MAIRPTFDSISIASSATIFLTKRASSAKIEKERSSLGRGTGFCEITKDEVMRRFLYLLTSIALAACSTPYQSEGFGGGFKEQRIAEDIFIVSARGNAFTGMETIKTYTLRRAAELSVQNGYKFFTIIAGGQDYKIGYITTPSTYQSTTTGSAYGSGNYAYGTAYTYGTYTPATTTSYRKPRASITIKMLNPPLPQGTNVYNAGDLLKYTTNLIK